MISRTSTKTLLLAALVVIVALALVQPVHAAKCSNGNLQGVYGLRVTGTAAGNPMALVAQLSADGAGTLTGMETLSNNGVISNSVAVTGTYKILANCTGTASITPAGGATANYNLVVTGGSVQFLGADAGTVQSGVALAQGTDRCTRNTVKGQFAFKEDGALVGEGPLAFAGQVTLTSGGGINGTRSGSANGAITSGDNVSGAFKIGHLCFGGAVLSINDGGPLGFNLVVVNGGQEVLFIQSNAGTVVSGTLEK